MGKYNYQGPQQFQPLGPWAYFGYTLLFSIPLVGFILLIVFSFNDSNINRRCFARSYWCVYILAAIIIAIVAVVMAAAGLSIAQIASNLQ